MEDFIDALLFWIADETEEKGFKGGIKSVLLGLVQIIVVIGVILLILLSAV
ncbi:hypothetical protein [Natroniella sp. ANB-PHB2]|uniref:hypothetical protein n=1 Tax=Natroniella sp. ANB-PHB2 TaxID=3384444 RepID=UPI0038D397B5